MTRLLSGFLLASAAFLPLADLLLAAPQERKPRKVAFLVGVGKFKHDLPNLVGGPQRDVDALDAVLKKHGFEVVKLTDEKAGKDDVEGRFKNLLAGDGDRKNALGSGDVLLVALCSHGFTFEVNGRSEPFVAGYDAVPNSPADMIALNGLIAAAENYGASKFFLVDACREETDPNRGRSRNVGIGGTQVTLPRNTAVLFSCKKGQLSHQPDALKHGLFTHAVLEALEGKTGLSGEVTWADLVSSVGKAFRSERIAKHIPAAKPQTPVDTKGEGDDVPLLTLAPVVAAKTPTDPPPAVADMAKGGSEYVSKTTGMKFRRVKADKFQMGSPKDEKNRSDDEELHEVTLTKDYSLGVYEVTRGQFRQFAEAENYKTEGEADGTGGYGWDAAKKAWVKDAKFTWKNPGFPQTDDHPVVLVSWNDAVAFCNWLSKKDDKKYRLPTEAEWEFACRAGSTKRFHFGDDDEDLAKYGNVADADLRAATGLTDGIKASDGYGFTAPVGKFKPNAFGLHDMHGNAWEWCQDYYGPYDKLASKLDPIQSLKQSEDRRVLRGGSWSDLAAGSRAAGRYSSAPDDRIFFIGFRVCLSPGQTHDFACDFRLCVDPGIG